MIEVCTVVLEVCAVVAGAWQWPGEECSIRGQLASRQEAAHIQGVSQGCQGLKTFQGPLITVSRSDKAQAQRQVTLPIG